MESIRIKDVSKFDNQGNVLLEGINLEIECGTTLCLIGPEKCGKTNLLLSISGDTKISSGEIYYGKRLINSPSGTEKIGNLLTPHSIHSSHFNEGSFFRRFASSFLGNRPISDKIIPERLELITEKTGIEQDELLGKVKRPYSKAERQKLELAKYMLTQKNIFLLDDPLTGMDSLTRNKTKESLKDILEELKVTTILITYFTEEAFFLGDRVAIMKEGRIEQSGGKEIRTSPANEFVRNYLK